MQDFYSSHVKGHHFLFERNVLYVKMLYKGVKDLGLGIGRSVSNLVE